MRSTRALALLLALLLSLPLLCVLAEATPAEEPVEDEHFFASMVFTHLDGTPFDTSVFLGKPILLNIWATWCPPCVAEMPALDELAAEYADRINIIGLHSEGLTVTEAGELLPDDEKNKAALELQARLGLTFPLLNPDTLLFVLLNDPQYGVSLSVLPTTWLIDGEGYIRAIIESANDKDGWQQIIDKFLDDLQAEDDAKDAG